MSKKTDELLVKSEEMDIKIAYSDEEFAEMMQKSLKDMKLPEITGEVTVGLDVGNITTIASCKKNIEIIESRLGEYDEYANLSNASTIEMAGEKFVVGAGEFENKYIKHEKENYLHLVAYALGKVVKKNNVLINLVASIPANQYNTPVKDALEKKLKANKIMVCKIDGKKRIIQIGKIMIVPESYGVKAIGGFRDCRKNAETIVLDIGGGTSDLTFYNPEGRFVKGDTIDVGLLYLYERTSEKLKLLGLQKMTTEKAKEYFDGELDYIDDNGNIQRSYKAEALLIFLKKLLNQFRGKTVNPQQANIIVCGGGAGIVASMFRKAYPRAKIITGVTVNAEGNEKVGEAKWNK